MINAYYISLKIRFEKIFDLNESELPWTRSKFEKKSEKERNYFYFKVEKTKRIQFFPSQQQQH